MKVLQLCHRVPFPANDGGNIAMINLADALISQGVDVQMLALNTRKHFSQVGSLPKEIRQKYRVEAVDIDTSLHAGAALVNLFTSASYNISRFFSEAYERALKEVLSTDEFDVVLMESLFMTNYIRAVREVSDARIVLRAHNVEYVIWQRLARNEKHPWKRWYLHLLERRLRTYETQTLNAVDAVLPITSEDEKIFREQGCRKPMMTTPVGINLTDYEDQIDPEKNLCLFHLGAMDWRPNLEGIDWFLDSCWPLIQQRHPVLEFYLAGRGFPKRLLDRAHNGLHCEGEISNALDFMKGKQLMIVPLKSGGGMRVKIIQGMALGKTIISTRIGAEGIRYTDGKNILIADTPEEFLARVERCLASPADARQVGREARKLIMENYSSEKIGSLVVEFLASIQ